MSCVIFGRMTILQVMDIMCTRNGRLCKHAKCLTENVISESVITENFVQLCTEKGK